MITNTDINQDSRVYQIDRENHENQSYNPKKILLIRKLNRKSFKVEVSLLFTDRKCPKASKPDKSMVSIHQADLHLFTDLDNWMMQHSFVNRSI